MDQIHNKQTKKKYDSSIMLPFIWVLLQNFDFFLKYRNNDNNSKTMILRI